MFQAIYDSGWHHPFVAWVGTLALALWLVRRRPRASAFLTPYLVLFGVEIFVDALFTGAWSPWPATSVAIAFVILGDWRLFVLAERHAHPPGSRRWIATSIALAFVVPLAQAAAIRAAPEAFAEPRRIYLVYELMFVVLAAILRFAVWPARLARAGASAPIRRWVLGAATFFLVQYALWATADVIILAGQEWGLLLRLIPNAMYYAGFLLFVAITAPEEAWA